MYELLYIQSEGQAGTFLNDRVTIAIVAASAGILITGIANFFLQMIQDKRRFENERKERVARWEKEERDQSERWSREDEVRDQELEREDRLRNYEERKQAYATLIVITNRITEGETGWGVYMELKESWVNLKLLTHSRAVIDTSDELMVAMGLVATGRTSGIEQGYDPVDPFITATREELGLPTLVIKKD